MPFELSLPQPDLSPSLDFADARGFKEWLKLVPIINVRQAHDDVLETLYRLNRNPVFPIERLKMLELLRDPVALLQEESCKRYLGKPFPLADLENTVWQANVQLWLEMSVGYRHCWQAALNDDPLVAEHKALCGQRALRYAALAVREYHFAYRCVPPVRWEDLYGLYRIALEAGIASKNVKDSLNRQTELSSCDAAFMQALLMAAGKPASMPVRQIVWIDRLLDRWSNQSTLSATVPERAEKTERPDKAERAEKTERPERTVLAVHLDEPGELQRVELPVEGERWRFLDIDPISKSIKKRIKYLRAGELPANIGLGDEYAATTAEAHLYALYQEWCDVAVERNSKRRPARIEVAMTQVATGLADGHFAVSGKPFVQPDAPSELRGRAVSEFQLFGSAAQHHNPSPVAATPAPAFEAWRTDNESALGFKLTRLEPGARLLHNQLLIIRPRPEQPWVCGSIRWLTEGLNGELEIGVRIMAGVPEVIAVRATGVNHHGHRFTQGLLLPAMPALKAPASLLLPMGWFKPGRILEAHLDGLIRRIRLETLVERGCDFERMHFSGELA